MKIIKPSFEIIDKEKINGVDTLKNIEKIGRTCYKSENLITETSAIDFVDMLLKRGHEAMIEHNIISVRFICDRGVSHELVRHRLASFAQESTRYCNYSKDKFANELTFILPCFFDTGMGILSNSLVFDEWKRLCQHAEDSYLKLLEMGAEPQQARSILPNSLKTEIVISMNLREWRHFFSLRCDKPAHPQMRELTIPLLKEMSELIPVIFDDLKEKLLGK